MRAEGPPVVWLLLDERLVLVDAGVEGLAGGRDRIQAAASRESQGRRYRENRSAVGHRGTGGVTVSAVSATAETIAIVRNRLSLD